MMKNMNNTQKTYRLYIIFKNGHWMQPKVIKLLVDFVSQKGKLEDFGTGNAYNSPDYLLDAIEDHVDNAMVIAWDLDKDNVHPRFFAGTSEISALIDGLKQNSEGDSWEIAVELNKRIRAAEDKGGEKT